MREPELLMRLDRREIFSVWFGLVMAAAYPATAQKPLNVPLTIQEALYPGAPTSGITREQGPVTVGIPLPDAAGIKDISQLGLAGAQVGQFRILARWPSGNAMWVLVDTQASLRAGGKNAGVSLTNGKGNFGGPDLAADSGGSISVNTGPAQFVIRKANFDLFDQVVVHGKTLVASGTSEGLVLMGPDTTVSVADPSSPANVSSVAGGDLPARTYHVRVSYATVSGETGTPVEQRVDLPAGALLHVASPQPTLHVIGYRVYVSPGKDEETLQSPDPVPLGSDWTEPAGGLARWMRAYPKISGVGAGCGVCDIVYASKNDSHSTAAIEENGPAKAVVRASGSHVDASGRSYMHYTVRMFFYKGKSYAKVQVILRNADEPKNPKGDFNSAAKGFTSYEARLTSSLGSGRTFRIGSDGSQASGSLAGQQAYLYQAYSNDLEVGDWYTPNCPGGGFGRCISSFIGRQTLAPGKYRYVQDGFQIVAGGKLLVNKDHTRYPQGWADVSDASGAGIETGVYQLAAYWPKSLQFINGGSEIRVGIWPNQELYQGGGGQPYYQGWPLYSIHDLFFNFHDKSLPDPANEFLAFQHYLVARASISHYNSSGVLDYPLLDSSEEDAYLRTFPVPVHLRERPPKIFRYYAWGVAGSGTQHELRWSDLRDFLESGFTGRYLFAAHFYRMVLEQSFPRSDGFEWRTHPLEELGPQGFPTNRSGNATYVYKNWMDDEHAHWYGLINYYFMTGDEAAKDQLEDGVKDRYLNTRIPYNSGWQWASRDVGENLIALARLYTAFQAMGDPDAKGILTVADQVLNTQVFPELQVAGFGTSRKGTSRTRGIHYGCCQGDAERGGYKGRVSVTFHAAILEQGLYEMAQARGRSWDNYNLVMDLAYGSAMWAVRENYGTMPGKSPSAMNSGFRYMTFLDFPNNTPPECCWWYRPKNADTEWFHFYMLAAYSGDISWQKAFDWGLQKLIGNGDLVELGSYMVDAALGQILHPPATRLVDVPVTVHNDSKGWYTLSWTVPPDVSSYRIKYMQAKKIVDWLNFDSGTNTFGIDPNRNWPWFASPDVNDPPAPAAAGSTQTYRFHAEGTQPYEFAVKAYVRR